MINIGKWVTIVSAILMALSVAPILLYATLGPEDGNPVGLGLLMVFGTTVFGATTVVGAIIWIAGYVLRRKPDRFWKPDGF